MRTYPLDAITDALGDGEGVHPDGYSGRGMYGKTCAAIKFGTLSDSFMFLVRLGMLATSDDDARMDPAHPASKAVFDLVNDAQTDSMGLGIVVYFPGWTFA